MSTSEGKSLSGSCLCGAVRYTAAARHPSIDACHCGMCRKWTAGPFFSIDCGDTVKVKDEANLGVYRSSEWAERCFCKLCGTSLFYRLVGKGFHAVSAETVDDKPGFSFTTQIFIDEKPDYYAFANETKTMTGAEVFAAFSDEMKG